MSDAPEAVKKEKVTIQDLWWFAVKSSKLLGILIVGAIGMIIGGYVLWTKLDATFDAVENLPATLAEQKTELLAEIDKTEEMIAAMNYISITERLKVLEDHMEKKEPIQWKMINKNEATISKKHEIFLDRHREAIARLSSVEEKTKPITQESWEKWGSIQSLVGQHESYINQHRREHQQMWYNERTR